MLNRYARAFFTKLLTPVAAVLVRLGISPDVVTIIGTLGVCFGALAFYPRGEFLIGTLVITAFVFADTLDGIMARRIGRSGKWGAYLDSTLDRVGDAAIFGGLVLWYADEPGKAYMAALALACLILGSVVSYAKARAEGLGMTANVGIAERADRLVVVLMATGPGRLVPARGRARRGARAAGPGQPRHRGAAHARGAPPGPGPRVRVLPPQVSDALTVAGFRVGWAALRLMPERAAYAIFDRAADLTVARGGAARLRSNYARVRPELDDDALDALVRDGMRRCLRYYCEAFRLPGASAPTRSSNACGSRATAPCARSSTAAARSSPSSGTSATGTSRAPGAPCTWGRSPPWPSA